MREEQDNNISVEEKDIDEKNEESDRQLIDLCIYNMANL